MKLVNGAVRIARRLRHRHTLLANQVHPFQFELAGKIVVLPLITSGFIIPPNLGVRETRGRPSTAIQKGTETPR